MTENQPILDQKKYVLATYRLVDKVDKLAKRAESIAVGLTVGSWTDLPAARQAQVQMHCGRVENIQIVEEQAGNRVLADVSIGYPVDNFNGTVASLLTTVFGKLSMDGEIRLVDLQIPSDLVAHFTGPKFGVAGIREAYGVAQKPLVMSIFKACVGLSLDELTAQFREQALGGVHLIKDDEIFFNEHNATPEQRVKAYTEVALQVAETTGVLTRYAVNLTGPLPDLFNRARRLADLGAGALLVNIFAYGYDVVQALAADVDIQIPIMAHPAVSGAMYQSPRYGIASDILLGQLTRLAGADIVLYPSPYGSVTLPKAEADKLVTALRVDNGLRPVMPAPAAGIYPGLVPTLIHDLGCDLIVNAGGGIHGHPGGSRSGGRAFVQAVDSTVASEDLSAAANHHQELAAALAQWGMPS